jgi:hypothetical protein
MEGFGMDLSGLGQGPMAVSSKHGSETSSSIKEGEFLNYLCYC